MILLQQRFCKRCKREFSTLRGNNYCSTQCQREQQKENLVETKNKPKARRGKKEPKICLECREPFISKYGNQRQLYCGMRCAQVGKYKLRSDISVAQIIQTWNQNNSLNLTAKELGCSYSTIRRLLREHGLKLRRPPIIRPDGYVGYTRKENHRRVMEKILKRELLPREHVHHIDGNKINNEPNNLFLIDGPRKHNEIHTTLTKCAFELMRKGKIAFDKDKGIYYLTDPV